MPNDHYVQRALMKFWSRPLPNKSWDNLVWVYDFSRDHLERVSAYDVFAIEGLNAPKVEARMNRLIETPLARFAADDRTMRSTGSELQAEQKITDPKVLTAVGMVFGVQSARALDASGTTKDALAKVMGLAENVLAAIAEAFLQQNRIGTFCVPHDQRLMLPQAGWFPFPIMRQGPGAVWAMALPLNPRTILFAVPNGVDLPATHDTHAAITKFSIGMGAINNQIVVPFELMDDRGEEDVLKEELREFRADLIRVRDQVAAIQRQAAEIYRVLGIEPPAGSVRFEPPK